LNLRQKFKFFQPCFLPGILKGGICLAFNEYQIKMVLIDFVFPDESWFE